MKSGAMFNYLKMALGMVPFVGTAIALYDAWNSANLAVAAFLRGDVGHGLAEVEAVLLSLIDAAMDILPGANAAPGAARAATRQSSVAGNGQTAGALQVSSPRQARRSLERFKGYEYEHRFPSLVCNRAPTAFIAMCIAMPTAISCSARAVSTASNWQTIRRAGA